jgi:hypothetical protein
MSKSQVEQLRRIGMFPIVRNRRGVVAVVESYEGRDRCITEETIPAGDLNQRVIFRHRKPQSKGTW